MTKLPKKAPQGVDTVRTSLTHRISLSPLCPPPSIVTALVSLRKRYNIFHVNRLIDNVPLSAPLHMYIQTQPLYIVSISEQSWQANRRAEYPETLRDTCSNVICIRTLLPKVVSRHVLLLGAQAVPYQQQVAPVTGAAVQQYSPYGGLQTLTLTISLHEVLPPTIFLSLPQQPSPTTHFSPTHFEV